MRAWMCVLILLSAQNGFAQAPAAPVWSAVAVSVQTPPLQTVSSPVKFLWDANPASDNVMGYRLIVDSTIFDVGNVLTYMDALPQATHQAALLAYSASGVSPPSTTIFFAVSGTVQPPDPCQVGGPLTLAVSNYTNSVDIGQEGEVRYKASGPSPVTLVQVSLVANGVTQVIGEIKGPGIDLRFVRAIGFAVPRVPNTYNLFVTVSDQRGCNATTTMARPLVVS